MQAANSLVAGLGGASSLSVAAPVAFGFAITATGIGSAGEVVFGDGSFNTSSFTSMAGVRMRQSLVNVFDEESTSVYIRAGRFVLENESLIAANASQLGLPQREHRLGAERIGQRPQRQRADLGPPSSRCATARRSAPHPSVKSQVPVVRTTSAWIAWIRDRQVREVWVVN